MYVKHKFGAKFDYYECQAVTVVVHVVSVQSFQFGSASWSFEMGFDVWLSAMSCVRMSGCQRCLVCGCLAVSDVLCADVWLSAMSCIWMIEGNLPVAHSNTPYSSCQSLSYKPRFRE